MGKLFGTNGIRGIPGKDLTDDLVVKVGRAVGIKLGKEIVVGCDGRTSSPRLSHLIATAINSVGSNVHYVGLAPTPAIQLYAGSGKFDGAVIITASHNPPEFNGIKVMGPNGVEIPRGVETEIEAIVDSGSKPVEGGIGSFKEEGGVMDLYVRKIIAKVDAAAIRKRAFTIVVDAGNGAQSVSAPKLFGELGCKVIPVFCEVDGRFPGRGSEPVAEKLTKLVETVRKEKADLGVAFDGDGDRVVFCDENGKLYTGDRSGALLLDFILSKKRGQKVVTTVATSNIVEHVVTEHGSKLIKIRVGSVDVTERMLKEGAIAGLEENGGFFYLPHQPVRDGGMTSSLMLDALAHWGVSMSEAMRRLPLYHQRKSKLECPNPLKKAVLEEVKRAADGELDLTDGVRIDFDDGSWVIVRPSGTEPLVRVFSESTDEEKAEELFERYFTLVEGSIKKLQKSAT
ncbi:MAG TPA: phosphoglucosamine mutase [Conexivisphaerales archaeon]|nr:phosphoglucosamine mutase [Conexivisphaerales archaeon]